MLQTPPLRMALRPKMTPAPLAPDVSVGMRLAGRESLLAWSTFSLAAAAAVMLGMVLWRWRFARSVWLLRQGVPRSAVAQLAQLLGRLQNPARYEAALQLWESYRRGDRRPLGRKQWRTLWQEPAETDCSVLREEGLGRDR